MRRATTGLGLEELKRLSKPGECLFCGEPRAKGKNLSCGDEICRKSYHRYYRRDRQQVLTRSQMDRNNQLKRERYQRERRRFQ